mgnify:CR=1 FL=1
MSDIPEEAAAEILEEYNEFMTSVSDIAFEYEIEDSYGELMMVLFKEAIENMVTKREDIPKFVNRFVQFMDGLYQSGELEAKAEFDNLDDVRNQWEDMR